MAKWLLLRVSDDVHEHYEFIERRVTTTAAKGGDQEMTTIVTNEMKDVDEIKAPKRSMIGQGRITDAKKLKASFKFV